MLLCLLRHDSSMRLLVVASAPGDHHFQETCIAGLIGSDSADPFGVLTERWDLGAYAAVRETCQNGVSHVEAAEDAIDWAKLLGEVDSFRQTSAGSGDDNGQEPKWFLVSSHFATEGRDLLQQADKVLYLCARESDVFEDCIRDKVSRLCYHQCMWPNHYRRRCEGHPPICDTGPFFALKSVQHSLIVVFLSHIAVGIFA